MAENNQKEKVFTGILYSGKGKSNDYQVVILYFDNGIEFKRVFLNDLEKDYARLQGYKAIDTSKSK